MCLWHYIVKPSPSCIVQTQDIPVLRPLGTISISRFWPCVPYFWLSILNIDSTALWLCHIFKHNIFYHCFHGRVGKLPLLGVFPPCPLGTIWVKYYFRLSKYFYSRQELYENKYITKSNWIQYINKTKGLKVDPRYLQVTKFRPYWTNFDQIIGYFAFLETTFFKGSFCELKFNFKK